jgi:mRNA interferase MazF
MDQGEVWWASFPPPAGRRPVVVLTRSGVIPHLTHITIAPCPTTGRPIPTRVLVSRADGMPVDSYVNLDNIQTVDKRLLDDKIVRLRHERMDEIFAAIRFAFDMPK